jgi:pilus assembly protein CpaF
MADAEHFDRPGVMTSKQLTAHLHRRLLDTLDLVQAKRMPIDALAAECSKRIEVLLRELRRPLSAPERTEVIRGVMDEIFGLGPLEELMRQPDLTDILVNGPNQIYIERAGRLHLTGARFTDTEHLLHVIQRIASRVGRRVDESSPMLDARLPDGSRVNATIPPLSLDGPCLSIRRFGSNPLDIERLVELNAVTEEMQKYIQACVKSRMNILISGGTGSGKTTLLNAISRWIPSNERVVTIEDAAELRLQRDHVVRLETRPPNIEGRGEITQRDLVRNSLRMRPDRVIIGEVRGAETLDMLQAMNTGHEGSMTTVHANNPRDALRRIENMVSMAGLNYPIHVIRDQIASSLNILIHAARLTGGSRRIVTIAEITGTEGDVVLLQEIFVFRQTGLGADGHAEGRFEACGVRPRNLERLIAEGCVLPASMFERRVLKQIKSPEEQVRTHAA